MESIIALGENLSKELGKYLQPLTHEKNYMQVSLLSVDAL